MKMRINKFLSEAGHSSRRGADKLIQEGKVMINGRKAVLGDTVDASDSVKVGGKRLKPVEKKYYVLFHKPVGVITTTDRGKKDNIMDALEATPKKLPNVRLYPVGRLDVASSGLILFTNDNALANRLLRPEGGHEKEYLTKLTTPVTDKDLKEFAKGVRIGKHVTRPAKIRRTAENEFSIAITEGKKRQIRRMCEALGYEVERLKRIRIMHLVSGNLRAGSWRFLTEKETKELRERVGV